jgi:hypothetical protein
MDWSQTLKLLIDIMNLRIGDRLVVKKDSDGNVFWKAESPIVQSAVAKTRKSKGKQLPPVKETIKKDERLNDYYNTFAKDVQRVCASKDEEQEPKQTSKSKKQQDKRKPLKKSACKIDFDDDEEDENDDPFVDAMFSQGMDYAFLK